MMLMVGIIQTRLRFQEFFMGWDQSNGLFFLADKNDALRDDTHKKKVFFSGRTTKVLPSEFIKVIHFVI